MKRIARILVLGATFVAFGAQADITQAPTGPAQLSLTWPIGAGGDELPNIVLGAVGNASVANNVWVADVTDVSNGLIHVGDGDAGIVFNYADAPSSTTWKDITIDLNNQVLTGDAYVNGQLIANDRRLFHIDKYNDSYNLPEGTAVLWDNVIAGACVFDAVHCSNKPIPGFDLPFAFMSLTSPVPEPSSGPAMALGLLAVGWGVRRLTRSAT
jgi:hypothetical protein